MGAVMVAVAVAMAADLDLRFQNAIADDLPAVLVNPTAELEESGAVSDELAEVRGGGPAAEEAGRPRPRAGQRAARPRAWRRSFAAGNWLNTPAASRCRSPSWTPRTGSC